MLSKRRGELAEMHFLVRSAELGLRASKPYGESFPYDSLVEVGTTCWRIQVKGCNELGRNGGYTFSTSRNGGRQQLRAYRKSEIDFFACYLFRKKAWYILPRAVVGRRKYIRLYAPERDHVGRFTPYLEAWNLLKQRRPCAFCLQACADTTYDPNFDANLAPSPDPSLVPTLGRNFDRLSSASDFAPLGDPESTGLELQAYCP